MPKYEIRIKGNYGFRSVQLHGGNEASVRRIASRYGQVLKVDKIFSLDFLPGMSPRDRNLWFYRMASMVGNRVPVTVALKKMADSFRGDIRRASAKMLKQMESGFSITEAMEQDPQNFPPMTAALVRAGINSGNTADALRHVAEFEGGLLNVIKGTMSKIYQSVGHYIIAFGLMWFSTAYLSPQVLDNPIFKASAKYNFEWTRTLGNWTMGIMWVILFVILGLFALATLGRIIAPVTSDRIIHKIPMFNDLVLARTNQLSLYRLSLLIKQGVTVEESLRICRDDTRPGILKEDFSRALVAIQSGKPWADSMTTLHPTDKASLAMSSDKQDVSKTLLNLSQTYAQLYVDRANFIGPVLATIAAFFIAASGAILFIQTMIPIMTLMGNLAA